MVRAWQEDVLDNGTRWHASLRSRICPPTGVIASGTREEKTEKKRLYRLARRIPPGSGNGDCGVSLIGGRAIRSVLFE